MRIKGIFVVAIFEIESFCNEAVARKSMRHRRSYLPRQMASVTKTRLKSPLRPWSSTVGGIKCETLLKKSSVPVTGALKTNSAAKINLCKNLFDERILQKDFFSIFNL